MSWLNSLNSSQPRHPPLSTDELSLYLAYCSDSLSIYLMAAEESNHRSSFETGCRCSLNCKLTETGPLLQYCSITSHLPFARLCRYSVENLHPVCYTKLVREQSQTYSFI